MGVFLLLIVTVAVALIIKRLFKLNRKNFIFAVVAVLVGVEVLLIIIQYLSGVVWMKFGFLLIPSINNCI